jgi:hypothetical protein
MAVKDSNIFTGTVVIGDTFGSGIIVGQSFTASSSYVLDSITLKLRRTGATGNLTVGLYATDGSGFPTGAALSTGTILQADIPTSLATKNVTMSAYSIVSGTKYAIYGDYPNHGGITSIVHFNFDDTPVYAGGNYVLYSGGSWSNNTSYDMYFSTHSSDLPAKASNPTPADTATGVTKNLAALNWDDASGADSYVVTASWGGTVGGVAVVNSTLDLAANTPLLFDALDWGTVYTWRVDTVNEFGTTTGDTWSFTTDTFDPPVASWSNLPGKTLGPLTGGIDGVDFYYTGLNFMTAVRRLVATAANSIWYENIGA